MGKGPLMHACSLNQSYTWTFNLRAWIFLLIYEVLGWPHDYDNLSAILYKLLVKILAPTKLVEFSIGEIYVE